MTAQHRGKRARSDREADRARFVGFAFAGGDLLLEVESDGRIIYAAGAARHLTGHDVHALISRRLHELISPGQHARLEQGLAELRRSGRLEPCRFAFASGAPEGVWLAGHRLDGASTLQLSLRMAPAWRAAPDLPPAPEFEAALLTRIGRGKAECLTLVDLADLPAPTGGPAGDVRAEIGGVLRELVPAGDAGWLSDDTLGLVHGTADAQTLRDGIAAAVVALDPTGTMPRNATLDLDIGDLTPADAGRALVYAINRFAASKGADFSISSLKEGLDAVVSETIAQVVDCRDTLHGETFELAFQPIVDLRSGRVHHHELLARFADGRSPHAMVTFAEQLGMVAEFDLTVCRRALEILAAPDFSGAIAVNLSGRSLESELFGRAILALLDQARPRHGRLLVELTESAAIDRPERVARLIAELRRRGIPVCLDDFGSGAAAFHYLRAFRVDYVKLDGDYVRSTDHRDQAILRGMIGLCQALGLRTIAEMVETPLQRERLLRLGVDLGQGYLFGRPAALPAEARDPAAHSVSRPT